MREFSLLEKLDIQNVFKFVDDYYLPMCVDDPSLDKDASWIFVKDMINRLVDTFGYLFHPGWTCLPANQIEALVNNLAYSNKFSSELKLWPNLRQDYYYDMVTNYIAYVKLLQKQNRFDELSILDKDIDNVILNYRCILDNLNYYVEQTTEYNEWCIKECRKELLAKSYKKHYKRKPKQYKS